MESIHFLTSHGANLIKERLNPSVQAKFPKGNGVLFQQDYFHRIHTIDVHIALQQRAFNHSVELLFFLTYFDKVSTGKKNGTKAETYIPL